jgi:hypothetical protein
LIEAAVNKRHVVFDLVSLFHGLNGLAFDEFMLGFELILNFLELEDFLIEQKNIMHKALRHTLHSDDVLVLDVGIFIGLTGCF